MPPRSTTLDADRLSAIGVRANRGDSGARAMRLKVPSRSGTLKSRDRPPRAINTCGCVCQADR